MRDRMNNLNARVGIVPVAAAPTGNTAMVSTVFDRKGADAVTVVINTGALVTAGATYAVTMDHGDDPALADASAVPADMLIGTLALAGFNGTHVNSCRKVGYLGDKRYVRHTITPTGNAAAAPISSVWVTGNLQFSPGPNPPA